MGELALLERLCHRLPLRGDVVIGAGDDCAVVRSSQSDQCDYLLKSDSCIEGVHFVPQTKGELVGNKALGRVLSDIAAMGGEPLWILVDLVAPSKTPVRRIETIYNGMTKLARQFNIAIVGGDVSAGRDLQLHVFGVGRQERGKAVLRSGAKAGEAIFVTGSLGGSLAGKHLKFQPRLREGKWLARGKWATAMIDVSDGLLRDLGHIMRASNIGARLMLNAIPVSSAARLCSDRKTALTHMFHKRLPAGEICALTATSCSQSLDAAHIAPCSRLTLSTNDASRSRRSPKGGDFINRDEISGLTFNLPLAGALHCKAKLFAAKRELIFCPE